MEKSNASMPEARSERRKLEHFRGRAFDSEAPRYRINDHQNDMATFERQV